jgi:hypothetical protein
MDLFKPLQDIFDCRSNLLKKRGALLLITTRVHCTYIKQFHIAYHFRYHVHIVFSTANKVVRIPGNAVARGRLVCV